MADPTADFFDGLGHRGPDPMMTKVRGTVRFDLGHRDGTDHWVLVMSEGNISASRGERPADCVITTQLRFFDRVTTGEANPIAALLRNEITVEGNLLLFHYFQRLLPGPPGAHDPREMVRERRQK
ncbi:SCP2 sterol-binding domain-containing protein [Micromonospora sp. NPDC050417]|uniref:SCP2 sterol-binding domain-containing protein n=1 Tax=Micromonospora sp. NPDC050417 TaxID=3364280 RepID=UPI0037B5E4E6